MLKSSTKDAQSDSKKEILASRHLISELLPSSCELNFYLISILIAHTVQTLI